MVIEIMLLCPIGCLDADGLACWSRPANFADLEIYGLGRRISLGGERRLGWF